jgi:hypothetical protein
MEQQVFKDFDLIVARLSEFCARRQPGLLVVDGFRGSGKTTLAGWLAGPLGAVHVELDKFWSKEEGYVANIRYAELGQRLCAATMKEPRWTILEGICAQGVLARIGLVEAACVYVKRLVANVWFEGKILDDVDSVEKAFALEKASTQTFCKIMGESAPNDAQLVSPLDAEILTYHFEFRPHKRSTFVYTWDDPD